MKKKLFLLIIFLFSLAFIFKGATWAQPLLSVRCRGGEDCEPTRPPPLPTAKPTKPLPPQPTATPMPPTATPTPSGPTPTINPNVTPTPGPETEMVVPLTGTGDYCQAIAVDKSSLSSGQYLKITSTAKSGDFTDFGYVFYNLDNLDTAGKAKPIIFPSRSTSTGETYAIGRHLSVSTNVQSVNLRFNDIDKKDKNWNYYMPKPKNIRVDAYFKNVNGTWSKTDVKCQATFKAMTIDPTPTPNAACVCGTSATAGCATVCFYDKFPAPTGFAYSSPIKCNLGNDIFSSIPSASDKNKWCRYYYKTKGDANGDGKANLTDYFYYKSVRYGAKVPPTVNVDFDGDGFVTDSADKAVILRSLK